MVRRLLLIIGCWLIPLQAWAGIPQIIHPRSGIPVGWEHPEAITVTFDKGPLGTMSNAQARTLVEAMMQVWEAAEGSRISFTPSVVLAEEVTSDNFRDYIDSTVCSNEFPPQNPSMLLGQSPVVFDDDGSIIDLLSGEGASQKVVGKAAYRCYDGTISDPSAATQAFMILNGRFIDGKSSPTDLSTNNYAGIILHELGHFLGLHHSMANEAIFFDVLTGGRVVSDSRYIPTMFPLVLRSSIASTVLKPDDVAAMAALYPTEQAASERATLRGTILDADGNGFRGANMVARRQDDPLCQAVTTISGRFCTTLVNEVGQVSLLGMSCADGTTARGDYQIEGLTTGNYTIEVSELSDFGGARKNMFPKGEDVTLPGAAEYYNVNDEVADADGEKTTILLGIGSERTGLNIILGPAQSAADKSISLGGLIKQSVSDCIDDPVNYDDLLATVTESSIGLNEAQPLSEALSQLGAGGCSLAAPSNAGSGIGYLGWLGGSLGLLLLLGGRRRMKRAIVLMVPLLGHALSAAAFTYLPATPVELAEMAGQIFHGTCQQAESFTDERGLAVTEMTYAVQRVVKGAATESVTFRIVGTDVTCTPGTEDILFLYPESDWGYTSPVAGPQGRFSVFTDADGQAVVRNPFQATSGSAAKATTAEFSTPQVITPNTLLNQISTIIQQQAP